MRFALFLAVLLLCSPAFAQEVSVALLCDKISQQQQLLKDPNYQAGVDVDGNPVVPADLNLPIKAIEYPIEIPIEIDIVRFLELEIDPAIEDAVDIEPKLINFTFHKDGRVEYNDQDISSQVDYHCVEAMPKPEVVEVEEEETDEAATTAPAAGEEEKPKKEDKKSTSDE